MLTEKPLAIDENIFPIYKVAALVNELIKQEVSVDDALNGTHLTSDMLEHSTSRISTRQLIRFYENTVRLTNDPAIGLTVGKQINVTDYGMYGYALISSENLREALEFSIRYHNLAIPTVRMELKEDGDHGIFEISSMLFDTADVIQFNLEFQFSLTFSLFKDMLGSDFKLEEVHFEYRKPKHFETYQSIFNCPSFFDQNKNQFKFKKELLDQKLIYSNPITKDISKNHCDKALDEIVFQYGLAHEIHEMLLRSKYKFPDIEDTANNLHMTSRTLRRKLKLQGTSFQDILNHTRKNLAINYLSSTSLCVDEIASILGYSDSSNFRSAFKKWTKLTPTMFRKSI